MENRKWNHRFIRLRTCHFYFYMHISSLYLVIEESFSLCARRKLFSFARIFYKFFFLSYLFYGIHHDTSAMDLLLYMFCVPLQSSIFGSFIIFSFRLFCVV